MSNVEQITFRAGWYADPTGDVTRERWYDGQKWTEHSRPAQYAHAHITSWPAQVMAPRRLYKTSHGFHLAMSIFTLGLWVPVWIVVGIYNSTKA